MTRVERLIKKHGTMDEFKRAIWRAYDTLVITEAEAMDAIRDYEEELRVAYILDTRFVGNNVINLQEYKKLKEQRERDKILKDLIDLTDKFKK